MPLTDRAHEDVVMEGQQGYTETANQLGHDIGMLLKHYRRAITMTEAEDFYNITPDSV